MEYFLSSNGLFIPFSKRENELYPHFLERVKVSLTERNNSENNDKREEEIMCEIEKKLNTKRLKVTYKEQTD